MAFLRFPAHITPKRRRACLVLLALAGLIGALAAAAPASATALRPGLPQVGPGLTIGLSASPTTLNLGSSGTVTATASEDVGPTPYWIEIFDVTTGNPVALCGSGTTCSATVEESAPVEYTVSNTQEYIAYVTSSGTMFPPPGIQATSPVAWVTWSDFGYQVSLTSTGPDSVTATASPTPTSALSIQIYEENGYGLELLTTCPAGISSCAASFPPGSAGTSLVAFVAGDPGPREAAFVAASNVITTRRFLLPRR